MDGLYVFSSFLAVFILSSQVFGLQKTQEACNSPLGIQNGKVPDSHLSASSYYNLYTGSAGHVDMKAKYCRLNHKYAWCTNQRKRVQTWLMVDLGRITNLTAISTQGYSGVGDYYVQSFKIAYSINGSSWKFVGKDGKDTVFVGNKHGLDIKNNNFDQIQARYVKIFPVTYFIRICLRIELYGCVRGSSITTTTTPTSPTPTSPTPTTPLISTSKIPSSTKTSTTTTIIPTPSAMTTSITTKATSITYTTTTSIDPSTSSRSASIATSSYTTGTPSHQHTTTVPSSQSVPGTSLHPSKKPSTVAMTTIKPSKGATSIATLINALHRKSDEENKKNSIITGFSILGGLVFLVFLLLLIFIVLRRRKRTFHVSCQLVDLPEYPYNSQINCNEAVCHSLEELENDSTLIEC